VRELDWKKILQEFIYQGIKQHFIKGENPLTLFHEYFGHGLFCERTQIGQRLVNLEKELLKEEQQEFDGKEFTLEDLKKFRKTKSNIF